MNTDLWENAVKYYDDKKTKKYINFRQHLQIKVNKSLKQLNPLIFVSFLL